MPGAIWDVSWAWIAMPLVLAGAFLLNPSNLGLLTDVGLFMLLALGLNITVGMTGLLVLGYAGFYAFGAYFFALGQHNLPFFPWWLAAPLAFPLGGLVGYLLGLPCLRLRGDYLAIVTLADLPEGVSAEIDPRISQISPEATRCIAIVRDIDLRDL